MKPFAHEDDGTMGFQIAPMVDVVFVIMLFFMVMAGAVKVENELVTRLPGSVENSTAPEFNDETNISISDEGMVSLNDEEVDTPNNPELPQLRATLMRLKENADNSKQPVVVTIISDTHAKYSRTIDVLNALAAAKISNVTFTVSDE
jgi:biopolymer transport protein ExbD